MPKYCRVSASSQLRSGEALAVCEEWSVTPGAAALARCFDDEACTWLCIPMRIMPGSYEVCACARYELGNIPAHTKNNYGDASIS